MCGLAGIYFKDMSLAEHANDMLSTLFDRIDHRGGDACGFATMGDDGISQWQKAAVDAKDFNLHRRAAPKDTRVMIAHTRWATQGHQGFMENNHPIRRGPFLIVHNGHIHNDDEVFELAERAPYGQVDSEAIAAYLSATGGLEGLKETMEALYGHAAVAAIDDREPRKLALARGEGSPLYVLETRRVLIFGSTKDTVLDTHRKHIGRIKDERAKHLDEGEMWLVDDGKVKRHTFKVTQVVYQTYKSKSGGWSGGWNGDNLNVPTIGTTTKVVDGELAWSRCDLCDEDKLDTMHVVPDMDGMEWVVCEDCYGVLEDADDAKGDEDEEETAEILNSQRFWDDYNRGAGGRRRGRRSDEFLGL